MFQWSFEKPLKQRQRCKLKGFSYLVAFIVRGISYPTLDKTFPDLSSSQISFVKFIKLSITVPCKA
jgi:hypothetical protein